jgi:hypothetical protein
MWKQAGVTFQAVHPVRHWELHKKLGVKLLCHSSLISDFKAEDFETHDEQTISMTLMVHKREDPSWSCNQVD